MLADPIIKIKTNNNNRFALVSERDVRIFIVENEISKRNE